MSMTRGCLTAEGGHKAISDTSCFMSCAASAVSVSKDFLMSHGSWNAYTHTLRGNPITTASARALQLDNVQAADAQRAALDDHFSPWCGLLHDGHSSQLAPARAA